MVTTSVRYVNAGTAFKFAGFNLNAANCRGAAEPSLSLPTPLPDGPRAAARFLLSTVQEPV